MRTSGVDRVRVLGDAEVLEATLDARVVAMRWDLIPWGLVIDLERPVSEGKGAPLTRTWLAFDGLSNVTWPMISVRVHLGCWLSSKITANRHNDLIDFTFSAQLPEYSGDGDAHGEVLKWVKIRARELRGVESANSAVPDDKYRILEREARLALGTDEEMLRALVGS